MHDFEKHKHFKDRYSTEASIGFDWLGVREIPDMRYPLPEPQTEKYKDDDVKTDTKDKR